jgi:hypothetical protein
MPELPIEWEHFATLEPVVFVLRLHRQRPGSNRQDSNPPAYGSATVVIDEEGHARICGLTSDQFTVDSARAVEASLGKFGIVGVTWSRITPEGRKRIVRARVRPAPHIEVEVRVRKVRGEG